MLYSLSRSLLFHLDPERAHGLALGAIARVGAVPPLRAGLASVFRAPETASVEVFGLRFRNRVGLAAGYDKDGAGWRGLSALGFGHIEIGTITPQPQEGNPRPRVFRLPERQSLINRMGFPGVGAERVARRLKGPRPEGLILGANIGKQKTTELEDAVDDYTSLMRTFAPLADYLAVNISSPNTPGLRRLQERGFLGGLLGGLAECKSELEDQLGRRVPVLVKLAPDFEEGQLETAVDVIVESKLDGIIATNTTVGREGVKNHPRADEAGGLSGAALTDLSTKILVRIVEHLHGALPVIAVGGIMNPEDAKVRIDAGATLVQLYTGLVYEGPGLVKRILESG